MAFSSFTALKDAMHKSLSTTSRHEPSPDQLLQQQEESMEHVVRKLVGETLWNMFSSSAPAAPTVDQDAEFLRKHDLDGAFLLPRLLVVGPPRKRVNAQDSYRNDCGKLRQALKQRFKLQNNLHTHVLLFDFAPQQSRVDADAMKNNIVRFDLSRATLEVLLQATEAISAWLQRSEENVAMLTCSNGIKISSLVAACVYAQMESCQAKQGAICFFEKRLKWKGEDFDELLEKLPPSYGRLWRAFDGEGAGSFGAQLKLNKLIVRQLPFSDDVQNETVRVVLRTGAGYAKMLKSFTTQRFNCEPYFLPETSTWEITVDQDDEQLVLDNDVALDFSIGTQMLFSFVFPVSTLRNAMKGQPQAVLKYGPDIMDEFKKHALPGDFELELQVDFLQMCTEQKLAVPGLELCSLNHVVRANTHLVAQLREDTLCSEFECTFALQRANNDLQLAKQELKPAPKSAIKARKPLTPVKRQKSPSLRFPNFSPNSCAVRLDDDDVVPVAMTPKKGSTPKKAVQRTPKQEEQELNVFLKQVIGTTLASPVTPRTTGQNEDLVVQFTQLLTQDPSFKTKIERLVQQPIAPVPAVKPTRALSPLAAALAATPIPPSTKSPAPTVESTPSPAKPEQQQGGGVTLGNHEVYGTFFKMLKCGVPKDCVEQKMKRDGHNIKALELGPNALYSELVNLGQTLVGDHEVYGKYFKMLKCGIPHAAVKQRMMRDGACAAVLDLGENATVMQMDQVIISSAAAAVNNSAKKKKQRAVRKTSIRWDVIPAERLKKGSTIWCSQDTDEDAKLRDMLNNSADFEHLFIQPPPPQQLVGEAPTVVVVDAGKQVLDSRRAQSVSIGMAKLKLTAEELCTALLALDEQVLTAAQVQVILGCALLPTAEELAMLAKHANDKLARADAFLLCIGQQVSDAAERVEALHFRFQFDELAQTSRNELQAIVQASLAVRTSTNLKDLLRIVLLVGNHINGTQDDAECKVAAISLASLAKLSQTKSVNKTVNVLEYMVGFIAKKSPHVLGVVQDLECVNASKRLSLAMVLQQVNDVNRGLQKCAQRLGLDSEFCVRATTVGAELDALAAQAKQEFASMLEYLGEDPAMGSSEFFTTLHAFLASLQHTKREVDEREKRLARKQQQQQQTPAAKRIPLATVSNTPTTVLTPTKAQQQQQPTVVDKKNEKYPHLAQFLQAL